MFFRIMTGGLGLISMTAGLSLTLSPPSLSVEQAVEGFQRYQQTNQVQIVGRRPLALGALLTLSGLAGTAAALLFADLGPGQVADPAEGQTLSVIDPPEGRVAEPADRPLGQEPTQPAVKITCLDDALYQGVSLADLAQTSDYETRVRLLAKSLKTFEEGWIWRLLRCPCLLVIGRPGAGKSSLAGAIAMMRELLGITITTTVSDPNAHLKLTDNIWFDRWDIRGARDDWADIGKVLTEMYFSFASCAAGGNHGSYVFDEVTCYRDHVDETQLGGFLGQVTSKARATLDYITVVSHNDTLQSLGGKAGEAGLKDDMIALYIHSVQDQDGRFKPRGQGLLRGAEYSDDLKPIDTPVNVPRWLDAAYLCHLFPEVYGASEPLTAAEILEACKPLGSGAEVDPKVLETIDTTGIRALQAQIKQTCAVELQLPVIRTALQMLQNSETSTYVIEQGLGLGGRNFQAGKQALGLLKRFLTPIAGE